MRALAVLIVLSLLAVAPASSQGISPDAVCITNAIPIPTTERFFCEPMESIGFIQFDQFVMGLTMLESEYPDLIEVKEIGLSVGDLPVLFVEVTNENSPVPREQKLQLGYSASIHANEAAGREGMTRVIEDLVAGTGPHGAQLQPLLDEMIVNVWFPNPDSWEAGDFFDADAIAGVHSPGVGFARANLNGVDLNREFPNPGLIHADHTPMSEPESQAVVKELRFTGDHTNLAAGVDLHGMLGSPNMIRSIIPNNDYDFRRMVLAVDMLRTTEERVNSDPAFAEWNTLASIDDLVEQTLGEDLGIEDPVGVAAVDFESPMEWGARWDMIGYTDSGFTSDYLMLSPRSPTGGMGAVGTITEFAYSHMVPDNKYVSKLTDMHVAGVRQIVRTQMEMVGRLETPMLSGTGAIAYAFMDNVVSSKNDPAAYHAGVEFNVNNPDTWFDFNQVDYAVSNLNFWKDMGLHSKDPVRPLDVGKISSKTLANFDNFVITNELVAAMSQSEIEATKAWVEAGGNLLLTDQALQFLDRAGITSSAASSTGTYLGYTDVQDWDHELLQDVTWDARVTGEGPAIGIQVGGNNYPQWTVDAAKLEAAGGQTVGTTGDGKASLGTLALGDGQINFIGAMLPTPVQEHGACNGQCTSADHRYGLADYSVSAFTYWLVMNSLGGEVSWEPIDKPFTPCYDFDPLYPCTTRATNPADHGEEDSPAAFALVLLGVVGAVLLTRRGYDRS